MTIEATGTRLACVAGILTVLIGGGTWAYAQEAAPDAVLRAYDREARAGTMSRRPQPCG